METKICSKCKLEKTIDNFGINNGRYRANCNQCRVLYQKEYAIKNKDKIKKYQKEYRQKNIEIKRIKDREYYKNNARKISEKNRNNLKRKEYMKEYRKNHKEEISAKTKEYKIKNREKIKYQRKKWELKNKNYSKIKALEYYNKNKNDYFYKLKRNIRGLIKTSLSRRKYTKNSKTYEIIGCDYNTFINYLLQTFKNNYGYEWDKVEPVHIDHIIPLATDKTEEEVIKLCHYTNLQLLKAEDNLKKSNKLNWKLDKKE